MLNKLILMTEQQRRETRTSVLEVRKLHSESHKNYVIELITKSHEWDEGLRLVQTSVITAEQTGPNTAEVFRIGRKNKKQNKDLEMLCSQIIIFNFIKISKFSSWRKQETSFLFSERLIKESWMSYWRESSLDVTSWLLLFFSLSHLSRKKTLNIYRLQLLKYDDFVGQKKQTIWRHKVLGSCHLFLTFYRLHNRLINWKMISNINN